jgi:hypothetical protein
LLRILLAARFSAFLAVVGVIRLSIAGPRQGRPSVLAGAARTGPSDNRAERQAPTAVCADAHGSDPRFHIANNEVRNTNIVAQ